MTLALNRRPARRAGLMVLLSWGVLIHAAGCGEPRPASLYAAYQQIHIGERLPDDLALPGVKTQENATTAQREERWSFGSFEEHAAMLLDPGGVVIGKRYTRVCAEAFLGFAWQYERGMAEWEVAGGPSISVEQVASTCDTLNGLCGGIHPCPDVSKSRGLLDAASKSEHWSRADLNWSQVAPAEKTPVHMFGLGSPVWHVERAAPDVLRIRIDDRVDICPLVATPAAWVTAPFWLKF